MEIARNEARSEADSSLESVNDQPLPSSFNSDSRRQSDLTQNHIISTNDILNHDYNQLKIDEGRQQRLLFKKETVSGYRDPPNTESDLFITHVTLNLDIVENRPYSGSNWKYNAIKRNNTFAKQSAKTNSICLQTRPRYVYFKWFKYGFK